MSPVGAILILMLTYTLFLISLITFIYFFKRQIAIIKINKKVRDEIKKRQKAVQEMKERGEMHEWITIQQTDVEGKVHDFHVCKKTGYCAELKQFFMMEYVHAEAIKQEYKKRYEEYRNAQVEILATEYKHSREEMEKIVESVFDIKKQFALLWMKEKNAEVQIEVEKN